MMEITDSELIMFHIPETYIVPERLENILRKRFIEFKEYAAEGISLIWKFPDEFDAVRLIRCLTHIYNVSKSALENIYDIDPRTCVISYGISTKIRFNRLNEINEYYLTLMPLDLHTERKINSDCNCTTEIHIKFRIM